MSDREHEAYLEEAREEAAYYEREAEEANAPPVRIQNDDGNVVLKAKWRTGTGDRWVVVSVDPFTGKPQAVVGWRKDGIEMSETLEMQIERDYR